MISASRFKDLESRPAPVLGGFNLTFLAIELRRLLRNRRTVLLTLVVPVVLALLFSQSKRVKSAPSDVEALTTIGLAVYGAMLAATSGGALVSVERALGWSRQLRLTPLRPPAYIAIKLTSAMILGLCSVVIVYAVQLAHGVSMSTAQWLLTGLLAWLGGLVFATFGIFMGYLLPTENVMQVLGPVLAVFALFGGLFVPVSLLPSAIQSFAPYMPPYGVAGIARYPVSGGAFDATWVLSAAIWALVFAAGAAWLFTRDTRRV
jgi:ABC-2 type transport system permease protein